MPIDNKNIAWDYFMIMREVTSSLVLDIFATLLNFPIVSL